MPTDHHFKSNNKQIRKRYLPDGDIWHRGGANVKEFLPQHKEKFLLAFQRTRCLVRAAKKIGFSKPTIVRARKEDPQFDEACKELEAQRMEELEGGLWKRAIEGSLEPVYQRGSLVGFKRIWDTPLQTFMARCHKPTVYNIRNDHDGASSEELAAAIVRFVDLARGSVPDAPPPQSVIIDVQSKQLSNGDQ